MSRKRLSSVSSAPAIPSVSTGRRLLTLAVLQIVFNLWVAAVMVIVVLVNGLLLEAGFDDPASVLLILIPLINSFLMIILLPNRFRAAGLWFDPDRWSVESGYTILLGCGMLVVVVGGFPEAYKVWRLLRADVTVTEMIDTVVAQGNASVIWQLPGFATGQPGGRHVTTVRSKTGRTTTTVYGVEVLTPEDERDDRRLWLGWEDRRLSPEVAGYYMVNPRNNSVYREAIADALDGPVPPDAAIVERIPAPDQARVASSDWLLSFLLAINGILITILVSYRLWAVIRDRLWAFIKARFHNHSR